VVSRISTKLLEQIKLMKVVEPPSYFASISDPNMFGGLLKLSGQSLTDPLPLTRLPQVLENHPKLSLAAFFATGNVWRLWELFSSAR
jgi:hypothetical protein